MTLQTSNQKQEWLATDEISIERFTMNLTIDTDNETAIAIANTINQHDVANDFTDVIPPAPDQPESGFQLESEGDARPNSITMQYDDVFSVRLSFAPTEFDTLHRFLDVLSETLTGHETVTRELQDTRFTVDTPFSTIQEQINTSLNITSFTIEEDGDTYNVEQDGDKTRVQASRENIGDVPDTLTVENLVAEEVAVIEKLIGK